MREETYEMYFSAYHFRPLVGGYTAFPSLLTTVLRRVRRRVSGGGDAAGADARWCGYGRGSPWPDRSASTFATSCTRWDPRTRTSGDRCYAAHGSNLFERLPAAIEAGRLERLDLCSRSRFSI